MVRTVLTSSVILFFGLYSYCQSKYINGYILTLESDTILGSIKDNGEIPNGKYCLFIKHGEKDPVKYLPDEIKGYRFIDSKFYIAKEVSVGSKNELVFLEYLVDGIVDVFSYVDSQGTHYYVQKDGQEIKELEINEKTINKNGTEYVIKNKTYTGYLNLLFADAPSIQKKVNDVSLNRKSLVNISINYHDQVCTDKECINYSKKLAKVYFSLGPTIGYNKIFFEDKALFFKTLWTASVDFAPLESNPSCFNFGLMAKVTLPYTKNKFELYYNAILYSYEFNSEYVVTTSWMPGTVYPFTIESTDLKHNLIFRYNLLSNKLTPFAELGGFLSQKLKQENTGLENVTTYNELFPKVNYFGLSGGFGVTYKYYKKNEVYISLNYNLGFGAFSYYNTNELLLNLGFPISLVK